MRYELKDLTQLESLVDTMLIKVLESTARDALNQLKHEVQEKLYKAKDPFYVRTNELLESISKTKIQKTYGRFVIMVYYDLDKIYPYERKGLNWGQHTDFWNEDVSDFIPLWIEEGTPNNPFYQHEGIGAFEKAKEWASVRLCYHMKQELTRRKIQYNIKK